MPSPARLGGGGCGMPRDDDKLAADMPAIRYFKVGLKIVFVIGNLKLFDISV